MRGIVPWGTPKLKRYFVSLECTTRSRNTYLLKQKLVELRDCNVTLPPQNLVNKQQTRECSSRQNMAHSRRKESKRSNATRERKTHVQHRVGRTRNLHAPNVHHRIHLTTSKYTIVAARVQRLLISPTPKRSSASPVFVNVPTHVLLRKRLNGPIPHITYRSSTPLSKGYWTDILTSRLLVAVCRSVSF